MNPATSLFLDLLRVFAAVGVVLVHTGTTRFSPVLALDPAVGHYCVVVFFVLSGYVIAHATFSRPQTVASYAIARLARLYSVLLPALLISAALLIAGRAINPAFYASFDRGHEPLRFGLSLVFLNESWSLSAAPPTNSPLWSLAYEFWYYALFGAWVFTRSRLAAALLCAGIAVLIGPKILLLLPAWLLGVAAQRLAGRARLHPSAAKVGLGATLAAIALWLRYGGPFPGKVGYPPYFFSNAWISDFVLGVLVASLIVFFHQASAQWRFPSVVSVPIRSGANMTFSLYLLHHPILVFLAAALTYDHTSRTQTGLLLITLFLLVALVSAVTEARRHTLAGWLRRALDVASGMPRPAPAK
jgi:peptidoglycan/LPS O-acetylase OafA/YrhL